MKFFLKSSKYLILFLFILSYSCSSIDKKQPTHKKDSIILDEIERIKNEADSVVESPLPRIPLSLEADDYLTSKYSSNDIQLNTSALESRFDINVKNADVRTVLMGLVDSTPYNMVIHPTVKGNVSLSLKEVTIPDVMRILRDIYGYEYRETNTGFQVLPVGIQSRIYHLNYLNVKRSGQSTTKISSGQISTEGGNGSSSSIATQSNSDLWNEIEQSLKSIIGQGKGRSVVVSPQVGMVIVHALPKELREVEKFLRITQGNLQRQVILEAKIIEVELNKNFRAGINWSRIIENGDDSIVFGQTGGGSAFETGNTLAAGSTNSLLNPSSFGGIFSLTATTNNFTSFIELLSTQGEVQVLSSPRVSTVNNQKAVIKVGRDEFFVTNISGGNVSGTNNVGSNTPDITLTPFFSGIALDVTPQIDMAGGVVLHIHPSVTDVRDQTKTVTVNGTTQILPLALSSVRESDSIVHAQSGQLIVIGGLMQNRTENNNASTPGLNNIPVVGDILKHKENSLGKSELVILLRPIVVNSTSTWTHAIDEIHDDFSN